MWWQFFLENAHFAVNLAVALVLFSVAWLYFDASSGKRRVQEWILVLGFGLLSFSFVLHAVQLESTILTVSIIGSNLLPIIGNLVKVIGYLLIIINFIWVPLQSLPEEKEKKKAMVMILPYSVFIYPFLSATVAILYLRRATVGLENHLKTPGIAFLFLAFSGKILVISCLPKKLSKEGHPPVFIGHFSSHSFSVA
jgi:hypothetical protein